ncbi:MAG: ABC transporter ATP-binding protein [Bacteroidetes bacterium]|nr:ABC transporter ATP-binding protein [Bacteroidota bacterium]
MEPIHIQINGLSKKFIHEWVFKEINLLISPKEKWVLMGSNGSGKSTLMQCIAGFLIPSKGEVLWKTQTQRIEVEKIYQYLSVASPYMELIEDFTLYESVEHQRRFKPFIHSYSAEAVIELMQLEQAQHKFIKNFSSGMKQRVRLGMAILADCPVLLLDEPCSNLDAKAISWYQQMIEKYAAQKTILVCSNAVEAEYVFCTNKIEIEQYK